MTTQNAIKEIENVINAAIAKGVFADAQSVVFIFNCLTIIKNDVGNNVNDNSK